MAEAREYPSRPSCSQGGGAPTLHGWQQQSCVPRSLLKAMPRTLGFEWSPSGPCGTLLQWLAKGKDRAAYTCQGMVFKFSELPQYPELRLSRRFPGVVAKVFWAEEIVLVLHGPNTAMRFPMTLLRQEQCTPAVTVLKDRGETFAFRFLCHVACILTWLRYQGYTLLGRECFLSSSPGTPLPPLGNVRLGFPA